MRSTARCVGRSVVSFAFEIFWLWRTVKLQTRQRVCLRAGRRPRQPTRSSLPPARMCGLALPQTAHHHHHHHHSPASQSTHRATGPVCRSLTHQDHGTAPPARASLAVSRLSRLSRLAAIHEAHRNTTPDSQHEPPSAASAHESEMGESSHFVTGQAARSTKAREPIRTTRVRVGGGASGDASSDCAPRAGRGSRNARWGAPSCSRVPCSVVVEILRKPLDGLIRTAQREGAACVRVRWQ